MSYKILCQNSNKGISKSTDLENMKEVLDFLSNNDISYEDIMVYNRKDNDFKLEMHFKNGILFDIDKKVKNNPYQKKGINTGNLLNRLSDRDVLNKQDNLINIVIDRVDIKNAPRYYVNLIG